MRSVGCLVLLAALATSVQAFGLGGLASVTIIDRNSGAMLTPHYFRGEYWVAGTPGTRYSVEIRNRSGGRLLAVTSVDGVNVVSGETAGWGQSGYVFAPGQRYQVTGWRKSDAEVAAFTFTESPNAYAARTGRPANIGVIGVAVFREREPPPPPPSIAAVPPPDAFDRAEAAEKSAAGRAQSTQAPSAMREPKLGTGHGEREYSYVNHTEFERLQDQPNEVIRIRYDSLDNLIAMGVVSGPHPAPVAANPFPASPDRAYVPDPP
jgi:hypothetical protein